MHRRISAVYEFPAPNHVDRKRIWEIHVNHEALKLADDIDFDRIALRVRKEPPAMRQPAFRLPYCNLAV